jgi:hypothetical protein
MHRISRAIVGEDHKIRVVPRLVQATLSEPNLFSVLVDVHMTYLCSALKSSERGLSPMAC